MLNFVPHLKQVVNDKNGVPNVQVHFSHIPLFKYGVTSSVCISD